MKNLIIIILLSLVSGTTAFSQKHCKCKLKQIERRNDDPRPRGRHFDIIRNGQLQHPVSTFYRYGKSDWFDIANTQAQNLASLRGMFDDYLTNEKSTQLADRQYLNDIYKDVYSQAFIDTAKYDISIKGTAENDNARIAKAAAFVLLVNLNAQGQTLSADTVAILKNTAISAIKRLEWDKDVKRPDDYVYRASSTLYSQRHYWLTKTLIMFLQSYDYLKAVYPNDQDVIDCGYLLHCYSREIYKRSKKARWSALRRNDNHSLMSAGVLGLASVVLADHSCNRVGLSWHPSIITDHSSFT